VDLGGADLPNADLRGATLSMNPHFFSNVDMMFWSRLAKVTWDSFSALTVIKFNY